MQDLAHEGNCSFPARADVVICVDSTTKDTAVEANVKRAVNLIARAGLRRYLKKNVVFESLIS